MIPWYLISDIVIFKKYLLRYIHSFLKLRSSIMMSDWYLWRHVFSVTPDQEASRCTFSILCSPSQWAVVPPAHLLCWLTVGLSGGEHTPKYVQRQFDHAKHLHLGRRAAFRGASLQASAGPSQACVAHWQVARFHRSPGNWFLLSWCLLRSAVPSRWSPALPKGFKLRLD